MTTHFPEFFPNSRHTIPREPEPSSEPIRFEDDWDAKPKVYQVRGEDVEFFTVGQLAKALNRQAVTIRRWEQAGIIPKSTFQKPGTNGDPRGRRRLYSRAQVEGLIDIAKEFGILEETWRAIPPDFTKRVTQLFRSLS